MKKLICMVLVLAMCLSLAACGTAETPDNSTPPLSQSVAPSPSHSEEPAPSEDPSNPIEDPSTPAEDPTKDLEPLEVRHFADLTHDGANETITLTYREDWQTYYLTVENTDGAMLWQGDAGLSHVGWIGFYLYQRDGKSYLMQWNPYGNTGSFFYDYEVFSLTEDGEKVPLVSNTMEFSVMNEQTLLQLDIGALRAFEQEVNALLTDSIILISTNEGTVQYSTETEPLCKLWTSMADTWERGQQELLDSTESPEARWTVAAREGFMDQLLAAGITAEDGKQMEDILRDYFSIHAAALSGATPENSNRIQNDIFEHALKWSTTEYEQFRSEGVYIIGCEITYAFESAQVDPSTGKYTLYVGEYIYERYNRSGDIGDPTDTMGTAMNHGFVFEKTESGMLQMIKQCDDWVAPGAEQIFPGFIVSKEIIDFEMCYRLASVDVPELSIFVSEDESVATICYMDETTDIEIIGAFPEIDTASFELHDLTGDGVPEVCYFFISGGTGACDTYAVMIDITAMDELEIMPSIGFLENRLSCALVSEEDGRAAYKITADALTPITGELYTVDSSELPSLVVGNNYLLLWVQNNSLCVEAGFTMSNAAPGHHLGYIRGKYVYNELLGIFEPSEVTDIYAETPIAAGETVTKTEQIYQYLMSFLTEEDLKAAGIDVSKGLISNMDIFDPDVGGTSRGVFLYRIEYERSQGEEKQVYYMVADHVWEDPNAGQAEKHTVIGTITEEELYSRYDRKEILDQYDGNLYLAVVLELYGEWANSQK